MITAMSTLTIFSLRFIPLAFLSGFIVLSAAIATALILWQPRPLEAMLPGKDAIALFSNVTREDVRIWSDWFPELRSVPEFADRLELGIIDVSNGARGWIISSPTKNILLPETNGTFRGQALMLSSSEVIGIMTGHGAKGAPQDIPRLSALEAFRALMRGVPDSKSSAQTASDSHIYLSSGLRDAAALIPNPLRRLVQASGGLLLSREGIISRIRTFGKPSHATRTVSAGMAVLSPEPDLTIAIFAPAEMLDRWIASLPHSERAIRRGQLSKTVHDVLGEDWSLAYDIMPLLQGATTLHMRAGTGSVPSFMLRGTTSDIRDARKRLAAFQDSVRRRQSRTSVTRRKFDRGFTSAIIGRASTQAQDAEYDLRGWTVRETVFLDGHSFLTATRGHDFVIGNEKKWLDGVLSDEHEMQLPTIASGLIAGGRLSQEWFAQILEDVRRTTAWTWLGQSSLLSNRAVLWSAETDGETLTLSIRPD